MSDKNAYGRDSRAARSEAGSARLGIACNMAETQMISLSDLLQEVGLSEQQLNTRVSDDHVRSVSLFLTSRERLAPFLLLDEADMEVIEAEGRGEENKKLKMLRRWKDKNAFKATYRKLVDVLLSLGMASQAESVCRLLQPEATSSVNPAMSDAVVIARENQQQIKGEFAKLQMLVCEKLQTLQINMPRFLSFLNGLFQCADFIPASKKIVDIFEAITRNGLWDFINYRPLQLIVKVFVRDDEEINTSIHKYRCALAGYLAGTKLADYIASMSPISEEVLEDEPPRARRDKCYFNKLTTKLKVKVTEESLDYLIELWDSISVYLGLPSLTYLLDEIHEGCVSVTWLIPPSAMPAIALKIDDPETAKFFSKLGIIRMEVDDQCLYEEEEQSVETATEWKQEQDSSIKQFPDSQEQVQREASQDIVTETTKQEQDSSSKELPKHRNESGWSEQQFEALQKTISTERKIRMRTEEEVGILRAAIAYKEVEIGQLREQNTALECKLSQTQEEAHQLREQIQQTTVETAEKSTQVHEMERAVERDTESITNKGFAKVLPPGWERRQLPNGRLYYVDHNTMKTQWEVPTQSYHIRLQWRRGADAPEVIRGPQTVVMGERVYVDAGYKVCQYDWRRDTWSTLPDCPMRGFGMAQFLGKLISVGGIYRQETVTGKVYQFNGQQWEEFIQPMTTARYGLTVATRTSSSHKPSAIAACGGNDAHYRPLNTVEVYSHASSQWHTAKPLPIPWYRMTSVTIDDTCYLLGGYDSIHAATKHCFSVILNSLIDNATSPHSQLDDPIWMSVSDTTLTQSTAASLRGSLIAVGGEDTSTRITSSAVHVLTSDGSWERVKGGDLPEPCRMSAAVCLPSGELLVAGGYDGSFTE